MHGVDRSELSCWWSRCLAQAKLSADYSHDIRTAGVEATKMYIRFYVVDTSNESR
jgi:hypothetical protein